MLRASTASAPPTPGWPLAAAVLVAAVGAGWLAGMHGELIAPRLPVDAVGVALLLSGLTAVALLWARPAVGTPMLVVFIYLNLSQVLARHFEMPSLLRALVFVLIVAVWRTAGVGGIRAALGQPLTAALALYTLVVLASTLWAADQGLADARLWEIAKAFVIFALTAVLATAPTALRRAGWALTGSAALVAGLGVWQHATGSFDLDFWGLARVKVAQIYGEVLEPRIAGPLGDPNFFAQILLVALPVAVALALREQRRVVRLLAGGAALLVGAALVLTYSRGAGLALVVELAVAIALSRRRLRAAIAALAAAALAMTLAPRQVGQRLTTFAELLPGHQAATLDPDSSFGERRLVTRAAWEMFRSAPAGGIGAGNYTVHFTDFADRVGSPERFYDPPGEAHYPHSLYLEIAAETGWLGLLTFAAVLGAAWAALSRARRDLPAGTLPATLAAAFTVALAGYLTSSLFLHGHFLRYLWLVFGFAAAMRTLARREAAGAAHAG